MNDIFSYIFLLAGIQGILLCALLISRKINHTANVFLGLSVLAFSIDLFDAVYFLESFFYKYPHLFGLSFALPLAYGPLFYLYIKILSTGRKFSSKDYLHFMPFFLTLAYLIPIILSDTTEKVHFINNLLNDPPLDIAIINHFKTIYGIVYTVLIFNAINTHNKKIKDSFSNLDRINLNWFKNLIIGMILMWLVYGGGVFAGLFVESKDFRYESAVHLYFAVLIYLIGYKGLKQPEIFLQQDSSQIKQGMIPQESTKSITEKVERYKKSGLSDTAANEILEKLIALIEKAKPFLNTDLTLGKLAEELNVSQHNLSEVINTKLNQNFYDFINKYRVEEFKKKLENPDSANYSLLALAFESGFNSKTSFNTIFKKFTQMTPSQYKNLKIGKIEKLKD